MVKRRMLEPPTSKLFGRLAVTLAAIFSLASHACLAELPPKSGFLSKAELQFQFPETADRKPVHFELVRGQILFKVQVNGHEAWAFLDNGAGHTLVDAGFARSASLEVGSQTGHLRTATGNLDVSDILSVEIEVPGQFKFRTSPGVAADLSSKSQNAGRPISLVLGEEIFDYYLLLINSNKTFQVGLSGSFIAPTGAAHFDLKNDRPQVDIVINNRPAVVTVDLGFNGAIALNDAAWSRLELDDHAATGNTMTTGEGRVTPSKTAIVERVLVGSMQLNQVPVIISPVIPENGDGLIGMGIFSLFNCAIDLKAHSIWLIPVNAPVSGASNADRTGATK